MFSTGCHANLSVVTALGDTDTLVINTARPFIYDTGLAPPAASAALAAIQLIRAEPTLVARVNAYTAALATACRVTPPAGAVLSVPMPGPREALARLRERCRSPTLGELLEPADRFRIVHRREIDRPVNSATG